MSHEVSLIAATVYGNRGAEAMLSTSIGVLRDQYPDLHAHVFSYYPKDDRARIKADYVTVHSATPMTVALKLVPLGCLFGLLRLLFGRWIVHVAPRSIRALVSSKVLVDLAGVSFIPGREKFLAYNVLTLLPAMLLGTPVVKMAQAMGPFEGGLTRWAARFTLRRCRKVWARGEQTFQYLQELNWERLKYGCSDDLAFNFEPRYSLSEERPATFTRALAKVDASRGTRRGVIGLCPSSVVAVSATKTGVAYESTMVEIIAALVDDGFLVVLFPNATRDESGEKQRNNDLPLIRRLAQASIDKDKACVDSVVAMDMDINAAAIRQVIEVLDVALVSRFHAMVGALSLCVPVVVLGWSHKYMEVMTRFGQDGRVLDYKSSATNDLQGNIVNLFEQRVEVAATIHVALPEVKASARRPLLSLLDDGAP